jgi:hypothetical protein
VAGNAGHLTSPVLRAVGSTTPSLCSGHERGAMFIRPVFPRRLDLGRCQYQQTAVTSVTCELPQHADRLLIALDETCRAHRRTA